MVYVYRLEDDVFCDNKIALMYTVHECDKSPAPFASYHESADQVHLLYVIYHHSFKILYTYT